MARPAEPSKAYQHFRGECERYRLIAEEVERNPPEDPLRAVSASIAPLLAEHFGRILRNMEAGEPFVAAWYCCAPEIYVALDLPWYMLMNAPFMPVSSASLQEDIDETEEIGLGNEMCSAIRLAILSVENETAPPPTAIVGLLHPCDGIAMLHNVVEHNKVWREIPMFSSDPPYFEDERSIDYYTGEMKRMTSFLEEHTGRKLDLDRLKEVVEESNRQYALWMEYNELRRAVPSPHGWGIGPQCMAMAQYLGVGDPRGTAWFRALIREAEQRIREKRSWLPDERIRVLWFDVPPLGWKGEVIRWCEKEWGANFVMDMFGYTPYSLIDTSSEESIFRGLARRGIYDTPMIRQAQGVADNFLNDIAVIVRDYKIDCVLWPGHVGHKDSNAAVGIMREFCRDLGVPFLTIGVDLYDLRYTTADEIKDKINHFFTALDLG